MRDVVGFEGYYKVTSCGKVWSVRYNRFIKPAGGEGNYQMVCLHKDNKQTFDYVHRIVAKAYIPNPDPQKYTDVNHKDEHKDHNWANNLEWCHRKYNINYGTGVKRRSTQVYCPETDTTYISMNEAARALKVNPANVWSVCHGHLKTTGGYHFSVVNN